MPSFQPTNIEWPKLPRAVMLEDGDWHLPDHIPLGILLELTPTRFDQLGAINVSQLHLSIRPENVLRNQSITTVAQLLELTFANLLALPSMGYGSMLEIFTVLFHLVHPTLRVSLPSRDITSNLVFEPLTLRQEWELYSGLPACPESLDLSEINLSDDLLWKLQEPGIYLVNDLLDQTLASLCEKIGFDTAEEVLDSLLSYATDVRDLPHPERWLDPAIAQDPKLTIAARWENSPLAALELSGSAARACARMNVTTISALLDALEPLHVELLLDPIAFAMIWMALQNIGLKEEGWEDAGTRLRAEAYHRVSLDHVATAWRNAGNPNHWNVVAARSGLIASNVGAGEWKMPTLDDIAIRFGVTRERVRQIEILFQKRMIQRYDDYFVALVNVLGLILKQAGGIISLDQAARDLVSWINPGNFVPERLCRFIMGNMPVFVSLQKSSIYALDTKPHRSYQTIVETAQAIARANFAARSLPDLAEAVIQERFPPTGNAETDQELPDLEFVQACLAADGRFEKGLGLPPEANLVRLLRELGSPRHFSELAERLNEKKWIDRILSIKYVHNQLLNHRELFVHVSAGTYGLVEWGMEDRRLGRGGTRIPDLMVEFLEVQGVPASKEEITSYVLARKNCRGASVMQQLLYDSRFHRFDKNKYGLSKWVF